MIVDACRPYDRLKTFPTVVNTSEADALRLRQKFPALFAADGKISAQPTRVATADPVGAI